MAKIIINVHFVHHSHDNFVKSYTMFIFSSLERELSTGLLMKMQEINDN